MQLFARFLIVVAIVQLIYAVGLISACWVQRMPIKRVDIFPWGPLVLRWTWGKTEVLVRTLPISISVSIEGMAPDEAELPDGFAQRSRVGRAAVFLSSVFAVLLVGALTWGIKDSFHRVYSGMHQILMGAWAPLSVGRGLVLNFFQMLEAKPIGLAVGQLCLKYAALCLLPLPGQNLLSAVVELLSPRGKRARASSYISVSGVFVMLVVFGAWFVAITAAVMERILGHRPSDLLAILVSTVGVAIITGGSAWGNDKKPPASEEAKQN